MAVYPGWNNSALDKSPIGEYTVFMDTKSERREQKRFKARHGMRVRRGGFVAIGNSQAKRAKRGKK